MKNKSVIAVTNLRRGSGASSAAVHLADSLARETDSSVLIIDLDLVNMDTTRYMKGSREFHENHSMVPAGTEAQNKYFNNFGAVYSSPCSVADLLSPLHSPLVLLDNPHTPESQEAFSQLDKGFSIFINQYLQSTYDYVILDIPYHLYENMPLISEVITDYTIWVLDDNDASLVEYEMQNRHTMKPNSFNIINDITQSIYNEIAMTYPKLMQSNLGALPEAEELSVLSQVETLFPLESGVADHYQDSMELIVHELMSNIVKKRFSGHAA